MISSIVAGTLFIAIPSTNFFIKSMLEKILQINKCLKDVLEIDFDMKYIENIHEDDIKKLSSSLIILDYFAIDKPTTTLPIMQTKSLKDVGDLRDKIITNYDSLINEFNEYFDRIETQLDAKNIKSFSIVGKTLQSRKKKFDSASSRLISENSGILYEVQTQLLVLLKKHLSDIIYDIIRPITSGLKENTAYKNILEMFNKFLSKLGVYTKRLSSGKKLKESEWAFINPQESSDSETTERTRKDVIKEVVSYPYMLAYSDYDDCIREGDVIMWRVIV